MMRRAMDGGRVVDANSDWTRVTNKRKERRNSARKQSGGSVSTVAGPSQPNLPPKPQSSVVKRRWTKMQPPSIPMSTSILRHQNVLLLNQWSGRIRNLAQSSSREIIQFLCSYWKTSQNLMQVGRFHSETASVVEAMAVLSECDQFPDVEFVILRVLLHVHWKELPPSCQGVSYFSALCRIFSSFLERGSPEAAMWIHGRRWVLTAIGEAFKYLVDKGKEAESVLGKLQKIDEEFSLRKRLLDEDSKTPTINKARECPEDFKVSSARCKKFEPTSIKTRGFADSNNNIAATHVRHGNTDVTAWQTVGRKKGVVSNRQQSYDFQMELCAPPLARTPRANKQSHATASAPGWSKVAGAHKELLTRLGRNWSPVDLPSYLKHTMELIPRLRGTNIKLDSFVSDVCKTPLVDNLRDFLVIQEEAGIASTTFCHISSFCAAVLKACPNIFYEHFDGIVDSALQAADRFSQDIHIQHAKKQILELHGMFVHTTYVSDLPQDSFRDMFVVPTQEDFQTRKVYLRPNVVSGPFLSVDHYLDVQFRLLREDFLKPLRDGLAEVRGRIKVFDRSEENRFNAMRIYKNVSFERNKERWLPGSLIMYFDPNRALNIDWRLSKRFMLGALLVISNDNFTTLHLARVTRRDWECLSAGWLVIEPLWSEVSAKKLCLGSFVVGESMVFFEPYLHVLNALQNINPDEFPLARYIVHADPTEELPDYLQVESNRKYCIPLPGGEVVQRDIVNGEWPTAAAMGLNESQHEALTRALTQKVMLVQGPPGTGKTFLGLRIVSTLLTNPQAWRGSDDSACPILIVCLTNHALDQFLFGLLATTKKIVRLGGRCKDERLTEYMLKRNENELSPDLKRRMWERRQQLQQAEYELDCIQRARRELDNNIGIVSWESFQTYQVVTDVSNVPDGFSIIRWLEKGIQHSALSDDDIQFIRQNPKWGSEIFSFEDTFSQMESTIEELQQFIGEGRLEYKSTLEYYIAKLEYLKQVVSNGLPPGFAAQVGNVLDLDADQRSQLYLFWVSKLKQALGTAERYAEKYINDCKTRMKQVKMLKDKELIASNLVVGMTTTKAAQIQPLLQELKPRIVVVEEAAEVLESHIIAALTPAVQHLILLGDHKQLRPSPSDHEVGKDFKLEVSLFERLSNNNMPCKALNVQHRMQPNIAKLIEFIYPGLENHGSVLRYPAVRGLKNSVFFVDHQEPDRYMDELISHCNPHEARFIAALVTYLLLQGYDEKQITILSAYAGQLMYFRGLESDFPDLRKVRVCNIDNFQGEESDIILLSLVRSNPQNNIGFLKTENRVCVALSRAKHGMIIVGNLKVLTAKSETWRKVRSNLQSQGAVGPALTLQCIKHPEQYLKVRSDADFKRWTLGGCETRCEYTLSCLHSCPFSCHRDRLDHQGIVCVELCNKIVCKQDHTPYFCSRLCHHDGLQTCEPCRAQKYVPLKCGHFGEMRCAEDPQWYTCRMDKTVALECGHTAKMPCSQDPSTYRCKRKEKRVLEHCGHENVVLCYLNGPCKVPCRAKLACGHLCERSCHIFDDPLHADYKCSQPCLRTRPGCSAEQKHACTLKCREKCTDCDVLVTKSLPCHHDMKMPCAESVEAAQSRCKAKCSSILSCGHPCKQPCGQECGPCEVEVQRDHPTCGHKLTMPCYKDAGQQMCKEPCEKILQPCSHKCSKVCGRSCLPCSAKVPKKLPHCDHWKDLPCWTGVEDVVCTERCDKYLPCKHRCRSRCAEPCQTECLRPVPCRSPCGHSVKVPCNERDKWCSEDSQLNLMSRCKKRCTLKLVCGHQCKGSCSECYQGRLHRVCDEKCSKILLCGHRCQERCGLPCLPCKQPCPVKCSHSNCSKHCGQRCSPCSKKCDMGKPTFKCEKKCRDLCTWSPSNNPCRFPVRKCQHDCIGFEGDPCPSMCRICDKQSKEFEKSSEQDRFLELTDCKHIVRFDDMERSIRERPTVVRLPSCPVCQVPVANSSRYGNLVKDRQEHIAVIYKDLASCATKPKDVIDKLKRLAGKSDADKRTKLLNACTAADSPSTHRLMTTLCEAMEAAQQGGPSDASARTMRGLCTYAKVLFMLNGCLRSVARRGSSLRREVARQVDALAAVLAARPRSVLSAQEVLDLNTELLRIQRLQQLCMVEEQAAQDGTDDMHSDDEYSKVSCIVRGTGPYPRKTLDDAVDRTIERLAASVQLGAQWWEEVELPRSAAQGSWYFCGKGHTYPKTGTERRCNKCPRDCMARILEDPS